MEEQKYFIPEIEDIRIGYEFELIDYASNNYNSDKSTCNCNSYVLEKKDIFSSYKEESFLETCICYLNSKHLRVPYLTKKQIENEGWALQEEFSNVYSIGFIKNLTYRGSNSVMFLYYNFASKWLLISIQSTIDNIYSIRYTDEKTNTNIGGNTLYAGKCKDINTLRYITKLLEI